LIPALGEGHQPAGGPGRQRHSVAIWIVESTVPRLKLDSVPTIGLEISFALGIAAAERIESDGLSQRFPGPAVVDTQVATAKSGPELLNATRVWSSRRHTHIWIG